MVWVGLDRAILRFSALSEIQEELEIVLEVAVRKKMADHMPLRFRPHRLA